MPLQPIPATHCGAIAQQLLLAHSSAKINGTSSRGIFIQFPSNWVAFITSEPYRGPLTINLAKHTPELHNSQLLERISVSSGVLEFNQASFQIRFGDACTWRTSPPEGSVLPIEQRSAKIKQLIQFTIAKKTGNDFLHWLAKFTGGDTCGSENTPQSTNQISDMINQLGNSLTTRSFLNIKKAIEPLLGAGEGLTPSGDDFIFGFLLVLNRWTDVVAPQFHVNQLNEILRPLFWQRTTSLSASLLECATSGEADERLIGALDGLVCAGLPIEKITALLDDYGNSSGLDALSGMSLCLVKSW